jgi:hypothetical protein
VAAGIGARAAVLAAAALVMLAVPSACSLSRYRPTAAVGAGQRRVALRRQMAAGFAVIAARRPLLRATVTSVVSYAGIGMLLVCCPLLGAQRLGDPARGALLISAIAVASLTANAILARRPGAPRRRRPGIQRRRRPGIQRRRRPGIQRRRRPGYPRPDAWVLASTLVIGVSMAAAALAPGWLTLAAVALGGAGEGPQLTALFAVRHRETPAHMRGQVYTTAASLKIAGLAAGAALAGPLAGWSVTGCLLVAAGTELCAAAAYLAAGFTRPGRREPAAAPPRPAGASTGANTDRPVRSG